MQTGLVTSFIGIAFYNTLLKERRWKNRCDRKTMKRRKKTTATSE
jgi:hypothetical protein